LDNLDNLPAGVSYALARNATYDVSYTFTDIVSINGADPLVGGEATFTGAGLGTLPVDNTTGAIQWNIGTVVTAVENDTATNLINPRIIIKYFARVNNDEYTNDSDAQQNSAVINYTNGEDATTEVSLPSITPVETVVESLLVVNQTVLNLPSPAGPTGVGDILEFRLTAANTGNSTAFDTNIVDTLPPELLLDVLGFPPTAFINAAPVVGFVSTPTGNPIGPLIWGRGNTPVDNSLDIPAGQSLVLTYHAIVQGSAAPDTVISNSVLVDWTSLDDGDLSSDY